MTAAPPPPPPSPELLSRDPAARGKALHRDFMRRNKRTVVLGSFAVLASTVLTCGSSIFLLGRDDPDDDDYDAYCVDQETDVRVEDDDCDPDDRISGASSSGRYHWYFIPLGSPKPAVGAKAAGGSYAKPVKGGFGGSGGKSGGSSGS